MDLQAKELAEELRYLNGGEQLLAVLLEISRERNICPWCLFAKTAGAVSRAMKAGDIDHQANHSEH